MLEIKIPEYAKDVLRRLESGGYEAFVVGGCVRDSVMGREPHDWDFCTSALPEETKSCFPGFHVIETGIKHGTITVVIDQEPAEITTYRIDGEYSDDRHPDSVEFSRDLTEDLARRDFTINALAYNPQTGIVDRFGGLEDIRDRKIRCVGDPEQRFSEDALRIMRAFRFAAVLGFEIEKETEAAALKRAGSVQNVAAERIQAELKKLVLGRRAGSVLTKYCAPLSEAAGIAFAPAEKLKIVDYAPAELPVRLALVFDGDVYSALKKLKFDNHMISLTTAVAELAAGSTPADDTALRMLMREYGEEAVLGSLQVRAAAEEAEKQGVWLGECESHIGDESGGAMSAADLIAICWRIIRNDECRSLKQLDLSGKDLIDAGFAEGREIGYILNVLLDRVISGELPNRKDILLKAVTELR